MIFLEHFLKPVNIILILLLHVIVCLFLPDSLFLHFLLLFHILFDHGRVIDFAFTVEVAELIDLQLQRLNVHLKVVNFDFLLAVNLVFEHPLFVDLACLEVPTVKFEWLILV